LSPRRTKPAKPGSAAKISPRVKTTENDAPRREVAASASDGRHISDDRQHGFPIVGIGASAGGLSAFEAFFSAMPTDRATGMAFVLVQHLSPDHKSILSDLVKRYTRMRVFEVEDGMEVRPDCAYIIPPNRDMAFLDGTLQLMEPAERRGLRLPIDFFFRSLAQDQHERAICIVLSGTGSDGTLGVRSVKGSGGMAMAQEPETTEHDGMPRSAIATGLVDYVLPPERMWSRLEAYVSHAPERKRAADKEPSPSDGTLRKISLLLRSQTGHDFSQYKENTLVRRLQRRMALHQIESPAEYLRYARENPTEVEGLFRDLLIGVTNFFRDPDAYAALEKRVLSSLFANRPAGSPIRVWVCGCSTGEEAYSIAILLYEHVSMLKTPYKIQVFATDIDRWSIEAARAGIFPRNIAADISGDRLGRCFSERVDGGYRIAKSIRDLIVFSEQDVLRDPPFSKLDLISCRNLLIYLNSDAQKKLIPLFHYALQPGGWLFLGTSESVGEFSSLFEIVDRKSKLYARREDGAALVRPVLDAVAIAASAVQPTISREPGASEPTVTLRTITERALLDHFSQVALLINGRGEIQHILGRTGKFLEPASGDASTMNVFTMAREGLGRPLTTALHKAVARKEIVRTSGLRVRANGGFTTANLVVRPVPAFADGSPPDDLYLVVFEEAQTQAEHAPATSLSPRQRSRVAALEQELRSKEEYLQTTLEEMETSNEELKSTNEEMQSVNEELQSTNEELETSKEELQSVNEQVATVNAELQDKVSELSRSNNDMNNLLAGTGVGTLFVDHQLRIARFTPLITQVINLIDSDIGRPVGHIVSNLVGYDTLVDDVADVLETLTPREVEVRTKSGLHYLMRMRPYRTLENVIEGAVLTFVEITQRKRVEEQLREAQAKYYDFFEHAPDMFASIDFAGGRVLECNTTLASALGMKKEEIAGQSVYDLYPEAVRDDARALMTELAQAGVQQTAEVQLRRRDGAVLDVGLRLSAIRDAEGRVRLARAVWRESAPLKPLRPRSGA